MSEKGKKGQSQPRRALRTTRVMSLPLPNLDRIGMHTAYGAGNERRLSFNRQAWAPSFYFKAFPIEPSSRHNSSRFLSKLLCWESAELVPSGREDHFLPLPNQQCLSERYIVSQTDSGPEGCNLQQCRCRSFARIRTQKSPG